MEEIPAASPPVSPMVKGSTRPQVPAEAGTGRSYRDWRLEPVWSDQVPRLAIARETWNSLAHNSAGHVANLWLDADGLLWAQSEWIDGPALSDLAPLPIHRVMKIVLELADLLHRLHQKGWVHGNLNPTSIRMRPDGTPVVTNWWFCRPLETPAVIPAETLLRPDIASDVHALAVLARILLGNTGTTPADVLAWDLLHTQRATGESEDDRDLAFLSALARMGAAHPNERLSDLTLLLRLLQKEAPVAEATAFAQPPLVGLDSALAQIQERLLGTQATPSCFFWLGGEAETGKTRAVETVAEAAQQAGWRCHSISAAEPDLPFDSWYRLMRSLLTAGEGHVSPSLRADVETCRQAFLSVVGYDLIALEIARARLADVSRRVLQALPPHERYLIIVDAWERADEASQKTLWSILQDEETSASPEIRWLIAGRSAPPEPLEDRYLELPRWSLENYGAWVKAKLHQAVPPRRFLEQLHTYTGGTAHFTDLTLRHLRLTGVLKHHDGTWRIPESLWPGALPRDKESLWLAALSRLSPAARDLQAHFALLPDGRLLLEEGHGYALWKNPTELTAVTEWLQAGLARFDVGQVRLSVSPRHVGAAHADAAALEVVQAQWFSRFDALPRSEGLSRFKLMPLLSQAGPPARKVLALLELGQFQMATGCRAACQRTLEALRALDIPEGNSGTLAWLEAWLEAHPGSSIPEPDPATPLRTSQAAEMDEQGLHLAARWLQLRAAYVAKPGVASAPHRDRLIELLQLCGPQQADLAALITLDIASGDLQAGRHTRGLDVLSAIPTGFEKRAPWLLYRAQALTAQLTAAQSGCDPGTCGALRQLIPQQAACSDETGQLMTLSWLMEAEAALGQWGALKATATTSRTWSVRLGQADTRFVSQLLLCRALNELGFLDAAVTEVQALQRLAEQRPDGLDRNVARALGLGLMVELGRFDAVSEGLMELLQAEIPADPLRLMLSRIAMARGLAATGDGEQALSVLQEGLFQLRGQSAGEAMPALQSSLAQLHASLGDGVAALRVASEALAQLQDDRYPHWRLQALLACGEAHFIQGNSAAMAETAQKAQVLAEKLQAKSSLALAEIQAGEAALARSLPSAPLHFQAAHIAADEIGHPLLKARALDGWGRSEPLADEAASRFGDAQRLLQRILALLPLEAKARVEQTPWMAALLERVWSGGGWLLLKPETHQATLERLGSVSAELSGLTTHYGLMIRAWSARRAQLSKLNELARTINESLSLDEVARNVLRVTLDLTGAERAFALLKSQGRYNDLIVRAGLNQAGADVQHQPLSMSVCLRVLQRGEPWAILDGLTSQEVETGQSIAALNLKTVMAAPLESKGTPIGVLYVDSQAALQTYTMQDLDQLAALAAHASCAIENALLYDTLVQHTNQLEAQLNAVRAAERQANLDALTGLRNRRAFLSRANREVTLARRRGSALSLILLDVDHFKNINDTYGHSTGDQVLVAVAQCMARLCRESDLLARLGGEEFVILCPETAPEAALQLAERLTRAVQEFGSESAPEARLPAVTISGGTAGWLPQDATIDTVLARADAALYTSKRAGRNRVTLA